MTLNELIRKGIQISQMLSSGDIPLTMNGEPIEITDITLEGSNGNYFADVKVERKEELSKWKWFSDKSCWSGEIGVRPTARLFTYENYAINADKLFKVLQKEE